MTVVYETHNLKKKENCLTSLGEYYTQEFSIVISSVRITQQHQLCDG
jgi:uncharacterized protein YlxP (DUF503 family)